MGRRRLPKSSFEERLAKAATAARERAAKLPPCEEREELLELALACDRAARINAWVTSPGLQAPKR